MYMYIYFHLPFFKKFEFENANSRAVSLGIKLISALLFSFSLISKKPCNAYF